MKLYLIDKYGKNYDLAKKLEKHGLDNIEIKDSCKFKLTKNDVAILVDNEDIDGLSKTAKILLLTNNKAPNYIWKFINTYNCADIIDASLDRDYIANRILSNL